MEFTLRLAPVYTFREFLNVRLNDPAAKLGKKILDCGAGGGYPPLSLFYEHGYETFGIDISEREIKRADAFCKENGMLLNIRQGDMRSIPFEDEAFSAVYEFYSMCHLTKKDTGVAIQEMTRVLKPGGYCFLGFMSADIWPVPGIEKKSGSGEFWSHEAGDEEVVHSAYADDEPDSYFTGLEIIQKEKRMQWLLRFKELSREDWAAKWENEKYKHYSRETWMATYDERVKRNNYSHLYYILQKPS